MKKKNGFWATLVAICLVIPAMFILTACGHNHTYSEKWEYDENYHWHICTDENCNETTTKENHKYDDDNDKTCDCGYERVSQVNTFSKNIQKRVYNGESQGLVQNADFTVTHGTASVSYKSQGSSDDFSPVAPTKAGKYVAKIVVTGNALYTGIIKDDIEFEIEKYDLTNVVKETLTIPYGKSLPHDERLFAPNDNLYGDKIFVRYTFDSQGVGSESTKAELITTNTDATVLNNYIFDATKTSAKIGKKTIYLDSTKENKLNIYNTIDDNFTLIELDSKNFGIIGSEKVSIKVAGKPSDFETGAKIKLVTSAEDIEAGNLLATLVGENAGNYYLSGTADATYTKRQSKFVGEVTSYGFTDYRFGASSDSIVYGENHFVVNKIGNKDWFEILVQSNDKDSEKDYINKEVEIRIWCGSTIIAKMYRVGSNSAEEMKYAYNNGTFDNDNGIADFKLTPNIDGYTDSEGRWICTTPSVTLTMDFVFSNIREITPTKTNQAFGAGKLLTGWTYVFKLKVDGSSDSYYFLSCSNGETNNLVAEITGAYYAEDVTNGKDEHGNDLIMYAEGKSAGGNAILTTDGENFDYDVYISMLKL